MEQPPEFAAQGEIEKVCCLRSLCMCEERKIENS